MLYPLSYEGMTSSGVRGAPLPGVDRAWYAPWRPAPLRMVTSPAGYGVVMLRRCVVVLAAGLLLAACATKEGTYVQVDTDADPDSPAVAERHGGAGRAFDTVALAAAADRTAAATTGRFRVTMSMDMSAVGAPTSVPGSLSVTTSGEGAYDNGRQLFSLTMRTEMPFLEGLEGVAGGQGVFGDLVNTDTAVVRTGDVAYLRMPMMGVLDPSIAGKWLRVDGSRLGALDNLGLSGPMGDPLTDPSVILGYLRGVGADLTTVGAEVIDGVETTHVQAVVSVGRALGASGADRERMEQLLGGVGGEVDQALRDVTFPVDVYLDADGYVRRVAMTYDFGELFGALFGALDGLEGTGPGSEGLGAMPDLGMTMTMTVDFFDLGQPVTITEPSPDDVVDICDVVRTADPLRGSATVPSMC